MEGYIYDISNVISINLDVERYNYDYILSNSDYETFNLECTINVFACYQKHGCGIHTDDDHFTDNNWMRVLNDKNKTIDAIYTKSDLTVTAQIFPNTFQNEESIPSQG